MNLKHGMAHKIPEYKIWQGMNSRCYVQSCSNYPRYGGRGVTVCDRWRHDFLAFLSDMGIRPSSDHQIDRIDNSLGYFPDNCRWITRLENSRKDRKLSFEKAKEIRVKYANGATLKGLAEEYSVSTYPIWSVVKGLSWM